MTRASPSITTWPPTVHTVLSVTRRKHKLDTPSGVEEGKS